jgi:hypothetical protein
MHCKQIQGLLANQNSNIGLHDLALPLFSTGMSMHLRRLTIGCDFLLRNTDSAETPDTKYTTYDAPGLFGI